MKCKNHYFFNPSHLHFTSLLLTASIVLLSVTKIDAQNLSFITTWKTDNAGSSNNTSITIPTDPGFTYSYDVDWNNDGTYDDLGVTGDITHDYGTVGTYSVAIRGEFPAIRFSTAGDQAKIISIDQWGDIQWESMANAFSGCINLTSDATDTPNLSSVRNCFAMFSRALKFNGDVSNWNVSNVKNMRSMFSLASSFNRDLNSWDVSNVTLTQGMLFGASSFNQNLSSWDLSSLVDASNMLANTGMSVGNYDATLTGWSNNPSTPDSIELGAFNLLYCNSESQRNNLINNKGWTITGDMKDCSSSSNPFITTWNTEISDETNNSSIEIPTAPGGYNYDIDWDNDGMYDTLGVTGGITHDFGTPGIYTIRIRGAFPRIKFIPQYDDNLKLISIDQWGDIEWSSFSEAFEGCRNLIYNATDTPDLSQVSSMYRMFYNCTSFDADLNDWDVSNVVNMEDMFRNCESFTGGVASWDVSSAQNMKNMFYECDSFNSDLSNWDVSDVTNMRAMFFNCSVFNSDISAWNVSKVQYMRNMLANCINFDQNLGDWELISIIDMLDFINNTGLSVNNYDSSIIGWSDQGLSNLQLGDAYGLLYCNGKNARRNLLDNGWEIIGDAPYCGSESSFITTWNTEISDETNNSSIEIPTAPGGYNYDIDWDNDGMYDTLRVTGGITHDFGTPGIYTIRIRGTFPRIKFIPQYDDNLKLVSIDQWGDIEWSSFGEAFEGCRNLIYNATDTPDLSQVSSMYRMFFNCTSFEADLNDWDVSNVVNMEDMFRNCESFTGGVASWDVSSVQNMNNMFREATNFNESLSQWNLNSLTRAERMLDNCGLDIQNYDETLSGWSNNTNTPENITLGADGLFYCNSEADRENLMDNKAWVFMGDQKDCTTSIQRESSLNVSVSPNPVRNLLYINAKNITQYKVKLINQFGQILVTGENVSYIDMSSYPAGMYYIKLDAINGSHNLKGKSISFIKTN